MEGLEIVIPVPSARTVERTIFILIILVLAGLLVWKWDGWGTAPGNATTSEVMESTEVAVANNAASATESTSAATSEEPCENGVKDNDETDIDCGGSCGPCAEFKTCNVDPDCEPDLYCYQHIKCLKASCEDEIKNQDETEVDCGGVCGGYWWNSDKSCHTTKEPSGVLEGSMKVKLTESPLSGFAKMEEVQLTLDNGLTSMLSLQAEFYARTTNGAAIFSNMGGEFPFITSSFSVKSGEKVTQKVDLEDCGYSILNGYEIDDEFMVVAVLKDKVKKTLIDEVTWVNS
ncbi:hypothetical protein JW711_04415 [Candidatus Woesearchaeota archaeon]|nr:hypothetical protein [Candidatus Woesearchaeota archaeon]